MEHDITQNAGDISPITRTIRDEFNTLSGAIPMLHRIDTALAGTDALPFTLPEDVRQGLKGFGYGTL